MSAATLNTTRVSKILLVDDHPIVRQGLAQLINTAEGLSVCGEASTAQEAMELVNATSPDVVIVDISLEDRSGVELIKEIVAKWPSMPCLALSMHDETMYAIRVLRAGGRGYIMKQEVSKKVLGAIRRVLSGHVYLSENMSSRLMDQMIQNTPGKASVAVDLTDRELEVLMMIGRGQSTRQIAQSLNRSVKAVESHRERIKEKLKLKNGTELLRYAVEFANDGTLTTQSEAQDQGGAENPASGG